MFPTIEYYKLGVAEEAEKSVIAREIASHSGLSDKGFDGDEYSLVILCKWKLVKPLTDKACAFNQERENVRLTLALIKSV